MEEINLYQSRFSGIGRLYGVPQMERLRNSHVAVIGIGGVGSWCAEALARSGLGHITLVDLDDVCISNSNRQIHALEGTVGQAKIDVMARRLKDINPQIEVTTVHDFFTKSTALEILQGGFDLVVDAIDSLDSKCYMIYLCQTQGIPLITVGGAGGRRNPAMIRFDDLSEAFNDSLLRRVRRKLRDDFNFPRQGPFKIPCVFSFERPYFPTPEGGVCLVPKNKKNHGVALDCTSGFGTASFVTGTFGFMAASLVLAHLTSTEL